jgi:CubicO group peptidase (beta-lactamase class C family)
MMWMYDHGYWNLESTLGESLTFPRKSPYAKIKWKDLLSHQAGLKNFIPFASVFNSAAWHRERKESSDRIVADSLYADSCIVDAIRTRILETPLKLPAQYEYSDLGYFFVKEFVELKTGKSWTEFLNENFYYPMGLNTLGYLPLERLDSNLIAPTENDTVFRRQMIRGYVHDETAALMGGVAGHAGLFSDAYDLAAVLQLLNGKGNYRGKQFIKPETVDLFNERHLAGNRRGLVLDKPPLKGTNGGSASELVSDDSFGHTGFTGTMGWVDPENDLVFVFLSNRIHPSVDNKKLIQGNYRTKIQTEVYKQLFR